MKALLLLAVVAFAAAAQAQPAITGAIQSGLVGERYDGYMGITGAAPLQVQRQVSAINIKRRKLYTDLGARRNVSPQVVGIATGCELLGRVGIGEAYMLNDGSWRRRAAGEAAPRPSYCR